MSDLQSKLMNPVAIEEEGGENDVQHCLALLVTRGRSASAARFELIHFRRMRSLYAKQQQQQLPVSYLQRKWVRFFSLFIFDFLLISFHFCHCCFAFAFHLIQFQLDTL